MNFEHSSVLEYDTLSTGKFLEVFRRNLLSPSSESENFAPIYKHTRRFACLPAQLYESRISHYNVHSVQSVALCKLYQKYKAKKKKNASYEGIWREWRNSSFLSSALGWRQIHVPPPPPQPFYVWKIIPSTCWKGRWVETKAVMDASEKIKISCSCREPNRDCSLI
jgi:hypothetical protein